MTADERKYLTAWLLIAGSGPYKGETYKIKVAAFGENFRNNPDKPEWLGRSMEYTRSRHYLEPAGLGLLKITQKATDELVSAGTLYPEVYCG